VYSECLPTRLNPLAERTCFSQVFDIEGAETVPNKTAAALTSLLSELRTKAQAVNPHFQISFTTPLYVGQAYIDKDGIGYHWAGLQKVVDFFIPMVRGPCSQQSCCSPSLSLPFVAVCNCAHSQRAAACACRATT
jgi:hypothetical protein